jgi:hypothetical protein
MQRSALLRSERQDDDEFEEFAAEDWKDEDTVEGSGAKEHLWEDNWDDDTTEDVSRGSKRFASQANVFLARQDFSKQLRYCGSLITDGGSRVDRAVLTNSNSTAMQTS